MLVKIQQMDPKCGRKDFGFAAHNVESFKISMNNLSILFKETEILKKSFECQPNKLAFFTKFSQA